MKRYLLFVSFTLIFLTQCGTVIRKNHLNIIYEGVGVNDIKLGDHQSDIIEIMGEPDDIWVNFSNFSIKLDYYFYNLRNLEYCNYYSDFFENIFPILYYNETNLILDHMNFEYSYHYEMNNMYLFFDEFDRITEIIVYFQTIADSGIDIPISDIHYYLYYLKLTDDKNTNSLRYRLRKNKFFNEKSPVYDSILYYNEKGEFTAISIISPVIGSHIAPALFKWIFGDSPARFIHEWTN